MKNKTKTILILSFAFLLAACGVQAQTNGDTEGRPVYSMMQRHMSTIPDDYAGLTNPIPPDEESIARGAATFDYYCVPCHGAGGMGDGEFAKLYNPQPAPIAHTSQMMGDDYLFWRVSEGGKPFNTDMVTFKNVLTKLERWDAINYARSLGGGEMGGGMGMGSMGGGMMSTPNPDGTTTGDTEHTAMLNQAIEQDLIVQEEANMFEQVHAALMTYISNRAEPVTGNGPEMQAKMLAEMVEQGVVTQSQADTFTNVHDILSDAGLME